MVNMPNPRIIMHIDMNAFFASVEQTANPFIRYKPVAVGSTKYYKGAALLAVSYEAKARGIKNLMRGYEAYNICPELICVPFDPLKYYSVNRQIIKIFREYTPTVEVYSIDEAFLDLTSVMHLYKKTPQELAQEIKDRIISEVGAKLTSSVGIAPNKLLAKVASDWKKPDGLTTITWENRFDFLDKVPIADIWGIGYRGAPKLERIGIHSTKQLREVPTETLRGLIGSYYTRLKMIANGESYERVNPQKVYRPHKSMQHAHTMSTPTDDPVILKSLIRKMSERLAKRLRRYEQRASMVTLGFRPEKMKTYGWGSLPFFNDSEPLEIRTNNGKAIYDAACRAFSRMDFGGLMMRLLSVGVVDLSLTEAEMFDFCIDKKTEALDIAADEINELYGDFTLRTGDILHQKAKESELSVVREDMTFHPYG